MGQTRSFERYFPDIPAIPPSRKDMLQFLSSPNAPSIVFSWIEKRDFEYQKDYIFAMKNLTSEAKTAEQSFRIFSAWYAVISFFCISIWFGKYRLEGNAQEKGRRFFKNLLREDILSSVVTLDKIYVRGSLPLHLQEAKEFAEQHLLQTHRRPNQVLIDPSDRKGLDGYDICSFRKMKLTVSVPNGYEEEKGTVPIGELWRQDKRVPTDQHLQWICYGWSPDPWMVSRYRLWMEEYDDDYRLEWLRLWGREC
jgi:hypothetical protein